MVAGGKRRSRPTAGPVIRSSKKPANRARSSADVATLPLQLLRSDFPNAMIDPAETWRVFIAIELPADVREQIIEHSDRLRRELPEVRASWTRAENLHLTLKFLGNIPVA